MKSVLVTGGAGFIGSHLTEALLARGDRVLVVDDVSTGTLANLAAVRNESRLEVVHHSLDDADRIREFCSGRDEVYHLAAAVGVALIAREPIQTIERNIRPTELLLDELCRRTLAGERVKFFLASTSEVYGKNPRPIWNEEDDLVFGSTTRPRWSYGVSKAIDAFLALACAKQRQLPVVIGRFFNVVGPRQSGANGMVLPRFMSAAAKGEPLIVHDDGRQTRCFAHVNDVVRAVVELMSEPKAEGRVFNIGSDRPVSIVELAERVIAITGSSSRIEMQSYERAYDPSFEDIRHRVPDLSRLRETIAFAPRFDLDDVIWELAGLN